MNERRIVLGILFSAGLGIMLLSFLSYKMKVKRGAVFDQFATRRGSLVVRATAFHETAWLHPVHGAIYDFEASTGQGGWRLIMSARHDDPIPNPRSQIQFLDDRVAYIFMGHMYAVTTEGGASWSVWDATKDRNWTCCFYIRDIRLDPDGVGTMRLDLYTQATIPEFHTTDYGRHWTPK